jgi:outer membrane protein
LSSSCHKRCSNQQQLEIKIYMMKQYLPYINFVLLLALGIFLIISTLQKPRQVYVLTQRVFDGFEGKKELESKLFQMKNLKQAQLDSLGEAVQRAPKNTALAQQYQVALQKADEEYQIASEKFTADIWKRLNKYIGDFGKERNYDFVFGASGGGNVMYADETNDATNEVIEYINNKYKEGDNSSVQ